MRLNLHGILAEIHKCTVFYFTPCPVPSCPAYEPNSNDCAYSQPFCPHPAQASPQTASHRYLGNALVPMHGQANVPTSPLRMDTRRRWGRLHQQEAPVPIESFCFTITVASGYSQASMVQFSAYFFLLSTGRAEKNDKLFRVQFGKGPESRSSTTSDSS